MVKKFRATNLSDLRKTAKKMSEQAALHLVDAVIAGGRISEAKTGKHFCWVTKFKSGHTVVVRQKRTKKSADSFLIY